MPMTLVFVQTSEPLTANSTHETTTKYHGRIEIRRCRCYAAIDRLYKSEDCLDLATRVRRLRSQVLVFDRVHLQKCHYSSANYSGAAGFPIPKP